MAEYVETLIVGGGQAGLSVSYYLKQHGREHVIIEESDQPGNAWRNHRWDSFALNTPNWQTRLPGAEYQGDDPDGFMSRDEIVNYFEQYVERFRLPVRHCVRVTSVEQISGGCGYLVTTNRGTSARARNVVIATGLYQQPKIPSFGADLPRDVNQLHSDTYRNPQELRPGAVLVVGSAQSGCQIAEELYQSGRKVYLAVGRAGRVPRRYRGKDTNWWSERIGLYDRTVDQLPSPRARFFGKPHISGKGGGHTLNLHQFARDGVILLGHLQGFDDGKLILAPDLKENLAQADKFEADFVRAIDEYIARTRIEAPEEELPVLRDGFDLEVVTQLDLKAAGITNLIWATSYRFDFSFIQLPIMDGDGYPIQQRGVGCYPGLYFVGLPWLHNAKSGLIYGVGEDAAHIATRILGDDRPGLVAALRDAPDRGWLSHDFCVA
jgi:putative flavoprotein involved in K+ transport